MTGILAIQLLNKTLLGHRLLSLIHKHLHIPMGMCTYTQIEGHIYIHTLKHKMKILLQVY